jgi:Family of unknown function (DUF5693)
MTLKRLLWLIIFLSLIPASILVVRRIQAEDARPTVTLLMDEIALRDQANVLGISTLELAKRYQALGLNGIALYEDTFESLSSRGDISVLASSTFRSIALSLNQEVGAIPTDGLLVSEVKASALKDALRKNSPEPKQLTLAGKQWYVYPGLDNTRPAGANANIIKVWKDAGFDLAYRPRNFIGLKEVGLDFPKEARYLIHAGLQVAGYPNKLEQLISASQPYLTGVIEGTPQDGMALISQSIHSTKLLSFNQDYINKKLRPDDLIDKYLLAANERGMRILYLRPYTEEQLGDMFVNTETFIKGLVARLTLEGYTIGSLPDVSLNYKTNAWLRGLSSLGAVSALILLTFLYPGIWGVVVAGGVLLLSFFAGRFDWGTLALMTALVFPLLGFGYFREGLPSLGIASLISLIGAVLLSAIGSDQDAMLSITPFAGVGATLVVPPVLYLFHYALRYRRPARWVTSLWQQNISLGSVFLFLFAAAAVALILVRRGNLPVVGASSAELALRSLLTDTLFVRPRFKELIGHPMAVLALLNPKWTSWVRAALMTGAVISQATILNSFSHYHTPLLISLQRTLTALVLGTILGLLLLPLSRLLVRSTTRWLESGR